MLPLSFMRRIASFSLRRETSRRLFATSKIDGGVGKVEGIGGDTFACGATLPALDMALRLAYPSVEFPATATGDEFTDIRDPCVLWREYYSLQHKKPYYHHLPTNFVTYDVPDGFLTRFPLFHRRNGLQVEASHRVYHNSSTENSKNHNTNTSGGGAQGGEVPPPPPGGSLTLKKKLAAYGGGGLLLYIIVHNILLAGIFFLLYFLHIDLVGFARSYGFNVMGGRAETGSSSTDDGASNDANKTPTKKYPSFWATLGISILLNKLLVPLEVALTLMMAPVVVPRLQPFASKIIPRIKGMINYRK